VAEERTQTRAPSALPPSRAERRSRIIRTALELLSGSDYDDIQMRDVAEESDVALATLYRYFPSKEQLFAAVQLEWVERLHRRVAQRGLRGDSDLERLLDVLRRSVRSFKTSPQFYRVLMMLESTKDPVARDLYEVMARATADTYRRPFATPTRKRPITCCGPPSTFWELRCGVGARASLHRRGGRSH